VAHAKGTITSTNYAVAITAGLHPLTADEPPALGGQDAGPAPFDLMCASLTACTAITLRMYAERKGWELGTIRVALSHTKHKDGSDQIEREIAFSAPLDDAQRARLAEIVEKTPVTKTIKAGAPIATRLA
jgi:putative redox protein